MPVESHSETYQFQSGQAVLKVDIQSCNSQQTALLLRSLKFLEKIPSSGNGTPLHQTLFGGGISGETYLRYLSARIYKIKCGGLSKKAVAQNVNHVIEFGKNQLNRLITEPHRDAAILEVVLSFIHEARHSDGFHHTQHEYAKNKWMPYDSQLEGAYGYEIVFTYNAFASLIPSKTRSDCLKIWTDMIDELATKIAILPSDQIVKDIPPLMIYLGGIDLPSSLSELRAQYQTPAE